MSTQHTLYVPKSTDQAIYNCFEIINKNYKALITSTGITLVGQVVIKNVFESSNPPDVIPAVLASKVKLIHTLSMALDGFHLHFHNGGPNYDSKTYDCITVTTNEPQKNPTERIEIITFISKELNAFDPNKTPSGILSEEQQNQLDIHLAAIEKLENLNADLSEKITKDLYERNREIEREQKEWKEKLLADFESHKQLLQSEYSSKDEKLQARSEALKKLEEELDLKDNTAARRENIKKLIDEIKGRFEKFRLSDDTIHLRRPIHIVCWLVITLSAYASLKYGAEFLSVFAKASSETDHITPYLTWVIGIKQVAFTAVAVSTVIYYLKWMNSWFDKNAQVEFHLKQLQLDLERANWVVESVLEWKQMNDQGDISQTLLDSLTNNLFAGVQIESNHALHPTDQLITLLGNVDKMELTGKGIKKAVKESNA